MASAAGLLADRDAFPTPEFFVTPAFFTLLMGGLFLLVALFTLLDLSPSPADMGERESESRRSPCPGGVESTTDGSGVQTDREVNNGEKETE